MFFAELFRIEFQPTSQSIKSDSSNTPDSRSKNNDNNPTIESAILLSQSLSEGDKTLMQNVRASSGKNRGSSSIPEASRNKGRNLVAQFNVNPTSIAPTLENSDLFHSGFSETFAELNSQTGSHGREASLGNPFSGISPAFLHFRASFENEDDNVLRSSFSRGAARFNQHSDANLFRSLNPGSDSQFSNIGVPLPSPINLGATQRFSSQNIRENGGTAFQNIGVPLPQFTNQRSSFQNGNQGNSFRSGAGKPLPPITSGTDISNFRSGSPSTSLLFNNVGVPLPSSSNRGNEIPSSLSNVLRGMSESELTMLKAALSLGNAQSSLNSRPTQSSAFSNIGLPLPSLDNSGNNLNSISSQKSNSGVPLSQALRNLDITMNARPSQNSVPSSFGVSLSEAIKNMGASMGDKPSQNPASSTFGVSLSEALENMGGSKNTKSSQSSAPSNFGVSLSEVLGNLETSMVARPSQSSVPSNFGISLVEALGNLETSMSAKPSQISGPSAFGVSLSEALGNLETSMSAKPSQNSVPSTFGVSLSEALGNLETSMNARPSQNSVPSTFGVSLSEALGNLETSMNARPSQSSGASTSFGVSLSEALRNSDPVINDKPSQSSSQSSIALSLSEDLQELEDILNSMTLNSGSSIIGATLSDDAGDSNSQKSSISLTSAKDNAATSVAAQNAIQNIPLMDLLREMIDKNQMAIIPLGNLNEPNSGVGSPIIANLDDGSVTALQASLFEGIDMNALLSANSQGNLNSKKPDSTSTTIGEQVAKQTGDSMFDFTDLNLPSDLTQDAPSSTNSDSLPLFDFSLDDVDDDFGLDVSESTLDNSFEEEEEDEGKSGPLKSVIRKKTEFFSNVAGKVFDLDLGTLIDLL